MRRRALLSSLGAAAAAVAAGCLGADDAARDSRSQTTSATGTTETTRTTASVDPNEHTVEVTRRVQFGPTGLTRVLHAREGGELTVDLTCPDGSEQSADATVSEAEWLAFERRVLAADRSAFAERYECEGDCPSDAPPARLTFDVDGCTTEVLVESNADVPSDLAEILGSLDGLAESVAYPSCD